MKFDLYGLIGYPIKHSLSPVMHNAAFRYLNMRAKYELFLVEPEKLEEFLLTRVDLKGFNITIPHKVASKEMLSKKFPPPNGSDISMDIKVTGAINTVKRNGEALEYLNTDTYGFWRSIREDLRFSQAGKTALIIGCGGAGRSVIASLTVKGSPIRKIYVYEKDDAVARVSKIHFSNFSFLKDKLEFISYAEIGNVAKTCELLVNASPLGMHEGDSSPIDKALLHHELSIYDVVYNRNTQLIADAKALGLNAVGGLGMLLYQGAKAFEFWTGLEAPVEAMKEALEEAVKKGNA